MSRPTRNSLFLVPPHTKFTIVCPTPHTIQRCVSLPTRDSPCLVLPLMKFTVSCPTPHEIHCLLSRPSRNSPFLVPPHTKFTVSSPIPHEIRRFLSTPHEIHCFLSQNAPLLVPPHTKFTVSCPTPNKIHRFLSHPTRNSPCFVPPYTKSTDFKDVPHHTRFTVFDHVPSHTQFTIFNLKRNGSGPKTAVAFHCCIIVLAKESLSPAVRNHLFERNLRGTRPTKPRKALRGGTSKTISTRFVNFAQQFATQWLQERGNGSKTGDGIPPRRAFCGLRRA